MPESNEPGVPDAPRSTSEWQVEWSGVVDPVRGEDRRGTSPRAWRRLPLSLLAALALACGPQPVPVEESAPARASGGQGSAVNPAADIVDGRTLAAFAADVESALGRYRIPGAAVAVVRGDRIVYAEGFGRRDLRRGTPVTADTLFRVGGVTQALTSSMIATLVDEDRLEWDQKMQELRPDLALPTDYLTRTARLRDLLGMTTGMEGRHFDQSFYAGEQSPEQVVEDLAALPVAELPGKRFIDQPAAFAAAGYLAALSGTDAARGYAEAYRHLMQQQLFGPAGMTRTTVGGNLPAMTENYAKPYAVDLQAVDPAGQALDDWWVEAGFHEIDGSSPTAGGASTARDLARFLILHLRGGIAESGKRVASDVNLRETRRSAVDLTGEQAVRWPMADGYGRGMGWVSSDLGGRRYVGAAGGVDGYFAEIGLLDGGTGLGLVVLTNLDASVGGGAFCAEVRDAFLAGVLRLELPRRSVPEGDHRAVAGRVRELAKEARPVRAAAVRPFLGAYDMGWRVGFEDGQLELLRRGRSLPLEAFDDDGYLVVRGSHAGTRLRFVRDSGSVAMAFAGLDGSEIDRVVKQN
ncbi:MAG: serine hydrolase domain-containing protein [Acidobacteriota bacterium]